MRTKLLRRYQGFSLVELLVGMAMGVIVLLIVMQSLVVAEQYKRTATNGTDAQINGLMALRTLESEIRMSGAGLTNGGNLCPAINTYYNGAGVTSKVGMAVKITDGATDALNNSDTIETVYSSSLTGAAPSQIRVAMPTASNVTRINTVSGMNTCDFVLFAAKDGSKTCSILQVTDVANNQLQFLTSSGQSNYNPSGGAQSALFPAGGYTTDDVVINMGANVDRLFRVFKDGTNDQFYLQQENMNAADSGCGPQDATPVLNAVSNVVNLQAQYGVAAANSQEVSCWTGAAQSDTGCAISTGNWSAPVAVDVKRIKAVRVAVVVRSAISEKPSSGATCDTTTVAPVSWDGGPAIRLAHVPDWQCYRYKVYQTVIPIINVIWANT